MRGGTLPPRDAPQTRGSGAAADLAPRARRRATVIAARAERSSMQVEWYGQSAFRLSDGRDDGVRSTRSATCRRSPAAGSSSTTRRSSGVQADLLLVTHEHLDHNGVEVDRRRAGVLRSTAGRLESPIGEVVAVASEHDEAAGTERGPNTIFVFELDGLRVCPLRRLRPARAARRAGRGDRRASTCCSCRSAAARRSARGQAAAIVERLRAALGRADALPHAAISFLETADAFLELLRRCRAAAGHELRHRRAAARASGPLAVVPAAP